jgi:hypothetical protein
MVVDETSVHLEPIGNVLCYVGKLSQRLGLGLGEGSCERSHRAGRFGSGRFDPGVRGVDRMALGLDQEQAQDDVLSCADQHAGAGNEHGASACVALMLPL